MKTFKQFMNESINDAGIFKAIFVIGIPGAGKSFTQRQLNGKINPKVVDTDIASEFLGKKFNKQIDSGTWPEIKDSALRITTTALENYLDGALPLFVNGTSNSLQSISGRIGILKSIGYDVGIVYVRADLDTAIARAEERAEKIHRSVDVDFIKQVFEQSDENAAFLRSEVPFFIEINNNSESIDDDVMHDAFKATQKFFNEPINNPVGKRLKQEMIDNGYKYISQTHSHSREFIKKKVSGWYSA